MPQRNYRFANETGRLESDNYAAYGNYSFDGWKVWGNNAQGEEEVGAMYTDNDDVCTPRTMMVTVIASGGRGTSSEVLLMLEAKEFKATYLAGALFASVALAMTVF